MTDLEGAKPAPAVTGNGLQDEHLGGKLDPNLTPTTAHRQANGPVAAAAESSEAEHARRVMTEAARLANLAPSEWRLWIDKSAARLGVARADLERMVKDELARNEKRQREAKTEERRIEQRAAKQTNTAEREQKREQEREQKRLAKEAEQERRQAEKEAEKKHKDKQQAFATLSRLPAAQHQAGLQKLAERLGEDAAALCAEFDDFLGVELGGTPAEKTEPWPEPVDLAAVLNELGAKIRRHVVVQPHQLTAATLWVAHTWLYDSGVPTHSPILAATSAEPDSGKTTLVTVVGRATPRFSLNIETSGPSLYRYVDAVKPTLALDECDDLFRRKSDLRHIVNAGWTRGATIPRQAKVGDAWVTVHFDPFTPKLIAMLGRNLPATIRTRCLELRMLPKRADEAAEGFNQLDDAEFAILRQKLARFATDSAAALKDTTPTMPQGMNNRAAANWKLLMAIADLAGGSWPEHAREAAERLAYGSRRPSDGVRLLAAFRAAFADSGDAITSEDMVGRLRQDPTSVWVAYSHGSPITQRQVAHLLDSHDIHPVALHPTKRSDFARQGYRLAQFTDAFARYLSHDPIIQSAGKAAKAKRKATRKKHRAARTKR